MKITLISPYPDITAYGLRILSAYLRENGHRARILFLPDPLGDDLQFGIERYTPEVLKQVAELCQDEDLIGITLMTNHFDPAQQITRQLKASQVKAPIIWGGVHPTSRPEECLEYCDMVCVGDGEESLLELADRMEKGEDYTSVPNIHIKNGDTVVKNGIRALTKDLDTFPMPDYGVKDHFIIHEGQVIPMTLDLMKHFLQCGTVSGYIGAIGYQMMTGRGCPHKCSYCFNDKIKGLYEGQVYLRWRSTESIMQELEWVKENMPFVGFVWISDDAFFARNRKNLREFCDEYKKRIGLPFSCLASPLTISEEKMEMLVDAGLVYVQMGIQSGSAKMQDLYNRKKMSNRLVLKATHIINKYKDKMVPPSYDFILDAPNETTDDVVESLRLIADLPKPFKLQPFAMVLYPGTKLYDMSKEQGLIQDENKEIYNKSYTMREYNYLNLLITLSKGGKFPGGLLKFLVSPMVLAIFNNRAMEPFIRAFYMMLKSANHSVKMVMGRA
ncbi:MAG: B12-binding domain-containing radical SAM protein [Magnetococcales bacterium]|nr:B12-binding domain-containing radical SAM protein [Magnetococcales bacterium]